MSELNCYIAGPMTGMPDHNFPAFNAAAEQLRRSGWNVINPAENFGGRTDLPRGSYIRADIIQIAQCAAMAMLPGWRESSGARMEYLIAREMDMKILDAETGKQIEAAPTVNVALADLRLADDADDAIRDTEGNPVSMPDTPDVAQTSESVLDEAKRITSGDRQDDYGHPIDDFSRVACCWTALLAHKLRPGAHITIHDVPICMIAVKLARQAHGHKRDNLVDIAGYARTAAIVAGDE